MSMMGNFEVVSSMHFPSPGVSRLAAATAGLTLLLMAAGAVLSVDLALTPVPVFTAQIGRAHQDLALLIGVLTVALLVWLLPTNTRDWVRGVAWAAVGVFVADAALSMVQVKAPLPALQSMAHAWLAPVLVALLAALAAFTKPEWMDQPASIDMSAQPFLPLVAKAAPLLVLIQIALGAGYRHKALSVMPHMAGAMLVALAMLVVPVMILQQFPQHASLRPMAIAALSIALVQVTLGIGAFVMRLLDFDTTTGFLVIAALHICNGALTLAASLVLAIEVGRCGPGE
jgi:heme A synthase